MNKYALIVVFGLSVMFACISCGDKEDLEEVTIESPFIQGLTLDNYPKSDGSTSTAPLNTIIACRILGIDYKWIWTNDTRAVEPGLNKKNSEKFWRQIKSSQTHQSFINLINKEADIILSARRMSADEKVHADAAGVSLIETPVALDAFIFIVHEENPVQSLTIKQVQDIYTGKITNWREVGGNNTEINPYVRNANSGSQELMETLVMKDLEIIEFPENSFELIHSMAGALDRVSRDINSICYTLYYYMENIATSTWNIKGLAINGIHPDWGAIGNRSYPYVAEIYAVIRSDLDKSSMAYKLYEWIQTEAGKQVINESGYVPY
jgi:phosphate transport system substrate-binding protein